MNALPFLLHAPDGFFSIPISISFWIITGGLVAYSARRASAKLDERAVPLMGVMAAFIFAAQMFNFQVPGGTSGHLLGGVLAAVLLGPWAGTIVMACVVAVQALIFQDGGLAVLGVNMFTMGIVGTLGGFIVFKGFVTVLGGERRSRALAAALAGWVSVFTAALLTAFLLAASDTTSLPVALGAMAGWHALIGIGEGLITAGALTFIAASRPDLLRLRDTASMAPA
jgi:cobalt/nickel transport system permease protein